MLRTTLATTFATAAVAVSLVAGSSAQSRRDSRDSDVETRDGGITINLPKGYSAELEAGTRQGRVSVNFPITVSGTIGRHLETTLGSGGPKLRAITTNGGVSIRQR